MAIHYDCGNGWTRTSFARRQQEQPVYLCCPGPSLPQLPTGPGYTVAAINTAYPRVRPDMWFGMDDPGCYDQRLWHEAFPKFLRGSYAGRRALDGRLVKKSPMTYFMDAKKGEVEDIFARRAHDVKFVWQFHTLGMALHGLVWMGFKDIRLVGCDMGGSRDYWHGSKLTAKEREKNRKLYGRQIEWLKRFSREGSKRGIVLKSCTPDSPINHFLPYTSLESSIPQATPSDPIPSGRLDMPVDVACVLKSGGEYGPEYVAHLKASLNRHMHTFKFHCLTDLDLPEAFGPKKLKHDWPGWWSKIELFRHFKSGRTICFDLDTVIRDDVNCLKRFSGFTMLRDFNFPDHPASGVMAWEGDHSYIYQEFLKDPRGAMDAYRAGNDFAHWGDQAFIVNTLRDDPDLWQDVCPHAITSFKLSSESEIADSSVVCYHGRPRPHETGWAASPGSLKPEAA